MGETVRENLTYRIRHLPQHLHLTIPTTIPRRKYNYHHRSLPRSFNFRLDKMTVTTVVMARFVSSITEKYKYCSTVRWPYLVEQDASSTREKIERGER